MLISENLIKEIRILLAEPDETHFTDSALTTILQSVESKNHALYMLWTQKVSFVKDDDIKSIKAGGESIEKYTSGEKVNAILKIAEGYLKAWEQERKMQSGSRLMFKEQAEERLW